MSKQVVERYNVSVPKKYTTAQGEEKTQWINIGNAVRFDDGSIAQNINALPTGNWWDGSCQLFKQEPRQQTQSPPPGYYQNTPTYGQQQAQPTSTGDSLPF